MTKYKAYASGTKYKVYASGILQDTGAECFISWIGYAENSIAIKLLFAKMHEDLFSSFTIKEVVEL